MWTGKTVEGKTGVADREESLGWTQVDGIQRSVGITGLQVHLCRKPRGHQCG